MADTKKDPGRSPGPFLQTKCAPAPADSAPASSTPVTTPASPVVPAPVVPAQSSTPPIVTGTCTTR